MTKTIFFTAGVNQFWREYNKQVILLSQVTICVQVVYCLVSNPKENIKNVFLDVLTIFFLINLL